MPHSSKIYINIYLNINNSNYLFESSNNKMVNNYIKHGKKENTEQKLSNTRQYNSVPNKALGYIKFIANHTILLEYSNNK